MDALVELYDETIGWNHGNDNWLKDDEDADIPSAKTWENISSPSAGETKSIDELDWCITVLLCHKICPVNFEHSLHTIAYYACSSNERGE